MSKNYSAPTYLTIELTSRCNLKCKHCYGNFPRKNYKDKLSTEKVKELIQECYDIGVFKRELGGGEPTLRKDFIDILKFASKFHDISIGVVTNGYNLSEEQINELPNNDNFSYHISIDGFDYPSYSYLRNCKTEFYKKVIENMKYMSSRGLNLRWNYALGNHNINEIRKIIEFAKVYNVKEIRLMILYDTGRGFLNNLGLNYKQLKNFLNDFMLGYYDDEDVKLRIAFTQPFEYVIPLMELGYSQEDIFKKIGNASCLQDEIFQTMTDLSCPAGRTLCSIDSEGDMHYCCILTNDKSNVGGNVLENKILSIWNNSKEFKWIRNVRLENLNANCIKCKYAKICGGGCRARAIERGDFLGPDPLCPYVKSYCGKSLLNIVEKHDEFFAPKVFSINILNHKVRVREEYFGASLMVDFTKYKYCNIDTFLILYLLYIAECNFNSLIKLIIACYNISNEKAKRIVENFTKEFLKMLEEK